MVDSTVARGGWAADEGTLLSFIGGSAEIVEQMRPVLATYSSDIVHTGGIGTAQVASAMALSQRTLQRELTAAGTTYRDVLDHVRTRRRAGSTPIHALNAGEQ